MLAMSAFIQYHRVNRCQMQSDGFLGGFRFSRKCAKNGLPTDFSNNIKGG